MVGQGGGEREAGTYNLSPGRFEGQKVTLTSEIG